MLFVWLPFLRLLYCASSLTSIALWIPFAFRGHTLKCFSAASLAPVSDMFPLSGLGHWHQIHWLEHRRSLGIVALLVAIVGVLVEACLSAFFSGNMSFQAVFLGVVLWSAAATCLMLILAVGFSRALRLLV